MTPYLGTPVQQPTSPSRPSRPAFTDRQYRDPASDTTSTSTVVDVHTHFLDTLAASLSRSLCALRPSRILWWGTRHGQSGVLLSVDYSSLFCNVIAGLCVMDVEDRPCVQRSGYTRPVADPPLLHARSYLILCIRPNGSACVCFILRV